jgi:hypothetical protein
LRCINNILLRTFGALDGDDSGLDMDLDALRDGERLLGVYVLHLGRIVGGDAQQLNIGQVEGFIVLRLPIFSEVED